MFATCSLFIHAIAFQILSSTWAVPMIRATEFCSNKLWPESRPSPTFTYHILFGMNHCLWHLLILISCEYKFGHGISILPNICFPSSIFSHRGYDRARAFQVREAIPFFVVLGSTLFKFACLVFCGMAGWIIDLHCEGWHRQSEYSTLSRFFKDCFGDCAVT